MLDGFELIEMPAWLKESDHKESHITLPLKDILTDSVYYPASYLDGDPVKKLMGNAYSFIYVDYSNDLDKNSLIRTVDSARGFKGYRPIFTKELTPEELCPRNSDLIGETNNITRHFTKREFKEYNFWVMKKFKDNFRPFALWFILERLKGYGEDHNPKRFSFLFIKGEGVATYNAIYNLNNLKPKFMVIKGSNGFAGNWTEFGNRNNMLAHVALDENSAGKPDYIFYRESQFDGNCCWPEYSERIFYKKKKYNGYYGIWGLPKQNV